MVDLRLQLDTEQMGRKFTRNMKKAEEMVRQSMRGAASDAAVEIEERGAADIEDAGNFGSRWTDGLHATVEEHGNAFIVNVTMEVPYWRVFEYGATIRPKTADYLWIPFSFAADAQGLWPRAYGSPLFKVVRKSDGLPMLFSVEDGEPKYFGKEQVDIPKKFHLREIIRDVAKELRDYYADHIEASRARS